MDPLEQPNLDAEGPDAGRPSSELIRELKRLRKHAATPSAGYPTARGVIEPSYRPRPEPPGDVEARIAAIESVLRERGHL